MRDPKRINRILTKLHELWLLYPDQRLGQLIENYMIPANRLFYQEDDVTEAGLDARLTKID